MHLRQIKVHETCWVFSSSSFFLYLAVEAQTTLRPRLLRSWQLGLTCNGFGSRLRNSTITPYGSGGSGVGNWTSQVLSPWRGLYNPRWAWSWIVPERLGGERSLDGRGEWGKVGLAFVIKGLELRESEGSVGPVGVWVLETSSRMRGGEKGSGKGLGRVSNGSARSEEVLNRFQTWNHWKDGVIENSN